MPNLLFRRAKKLSGRMAASRGRLKLATLLKWENGWKTEVLRHALKLRNGDFIDIGANIGQTLLDFYAVGARGRYIGFEPNPTSFASLFTLVQENRFKNCITLPVGLSDTTAVINLYTRIEEPTDLTASIVPDLRPGREHAQTPVLCCRFDDLRRALGITSIGLIKIDVEGAELSVLHGMEKSLRELRAPILCEILYADATADILQYEVGIKLLVNFITEMEYTMFRVRMDRGGNNFYGLVQTAGLPIKVWSADNAHECDYMLLPAERVGDYARLMAPS